MLLESQVFARYRKPVHVPALPGDTGLSIGYLYQQLQPQQPQDITFAGPPLEGIHVVEQLRQQHNGTAATAQVCAVGVAFRSAAQ